jgi:hypothetical protein
MQVSHKPAPLPPSSPPTGTDVHICDQARLLHPSCMPAACTSTQPSRPSPAQLRHSCSSQASPRNPCQPCTTPPPLPQSTQHPAAATLPLQPATFFCAAFFRIWDCTPGPVADTKVVRSWARPARWEGGGGSSPPRLAAAACQCSLRGRCHLPSPPHPAHVQTAAAPSLQGSNPHTKRRGSTGSTSAAGGQLAPGNSEK